MRLLSLALLTAGLAAACATSEGNQQGAASQSPAGAEQVCKRMTATGSNMPQKVCHSPDVWAAMERQGREGVEEFERQRSEVNPVGAQ